MGWTRHTSSIVYENDWFRVCEDRVTNPGGGQNLYGHVHFKNIAVAIMPLDEDNNTWLVGQDRYTLGAYSWELPMGGAPRDEPLLDAAKRELREETGLVAANWIEVMRLHTSNSITDELGVVFQATALQQGATAFEETEDLAIRKLAIDDAIQLVIDGEITDAITVAALLRFRVTGRAAMR